MTIDRARARRLLRAAAALLAAALPFLLGAVVGGVVRALLLLWLAVLWVVGAALAGYDLGRGRH